MVVLNKIYTRTGDAGDTALGDGSRVGKASARVAAYGTVDETNATVGMARLHAEGEADAALARIQNDLFDLGADLCTPDLEKDGEREYPPLRMVAAQVERLEAEIAKLADLLSDAELYTREPVKFAKATEALTERQAKLDAAEEEWLLLEEKAGG